MSFTVSPAAARPCSKRSLFIRFQSGRAGRGLSLPTQESIRMLWCALLMMKPCTHSTTLPLAGSLNPPSHHARFPSSSSSLRVLKQLLGDAREELEDGEERRLLFDNRMNGDVLECNCLGHGALSST